MLRTTRGDRLDPPPSDERYFRSELELLPDVKLAHSVDDDGTFVFRIPPDRLAPLVGLLEMSGFSKALFGHAPGVVC
jgi:hypothetical protein